MLQEFVPEVKTYPGGDYDARVLDGFTYVGAELGPDQSERVRRLALAARELACLCVLYCPRSRELSLALTSLNQGVLWARNAIATEAE